MTQPDTDPGSSRASTQRYEQKLSRSLTLRGNVLITLSSVTPASSVFIIIPSIIVAVGGASFVSLVVAGLVGVATVFCYAELSSAVPIAGGEYSFAARVLGKSTGFALFLMNALSIVLIIAVVALGTGEYLSAAWAGGNSTWVGVVVLLICAGVAVLNIRLNSWVAGTFLVVEMAALVVLVVLGFLNVSRPLSTLFDPQTLGGGGGTLAAASWGLVAAQTATAIFAYNSYGAAVYFAEETRGGHTVNTLVSLGIALAIINAVVAITLQAGRTVYASARDCAYPDPVSNTLGYVHPRLQTPVTATLLVGVIAAVIAAVVPLNTLITATGATVVVLYAVVALSALFGRRNGTTRYARHARYARYRMPAFPVAPVVVIVALAYVTYQLFRANPAQVAIAEGVKRLETVAV